MAYPKQKRFEPMEIITYYGHLGESALNNADLTVAEKCLNIMESVNPRHMTTTILRVAVQNKRHPIKSKLMLLAFVIAVLGIIALVVWGIYRLFTWIF